MSDDKNQDADLPEDIEQENIEIKKLADLSGETESESELNDILAEIEEATSEEVEPAVSADEEVGSALIPADDFADESYESKKQTTANSDDALQWGALAHLSSLLGLVTGFGFILGPILVWLLKKDDDPFIEENAKESINFQVNLLVLELILGFIAFVAAISFIGLPLLCLIAPIALVLLGVQIVLPIIAGMRVNDGGTYRYPFIYRFFK